MLVALTCLLPLVIGIFGFGNTTYAAEDETVAVTLHKNKMDQFPTTTIQNTGDKMSEFERYEGLPGVKFDVWEVSADFYQQLNQTIKQDASDAEYQKAVKDLMSTYTLPADAGAALQTVVTDGNGEAKFEGLEKRNADGTYKIYLFVEEAADDRETISAPLILMLPVINKEGVENTNIHLYPKNKIKTDISKELLDDEGNPIAGENDSLIDYEIGKKITYRVGLTIPNQIGEFVTDEKGQEIPRYTALNLKDAVSEKGLKFEGIDKIIVGTDETKDIKDDFLSHSAASYTNAGTDFSGYAGFEIKMNLDPQYLDKAKETADYLKQYAGKTIYIYYAVSFTDETPVDTSVENEFTVDLGHDGESENKKVEEEIPSIITGGKKFFKHEDGKETQALQGAEFKVYKIVNGQKLYLKKGTNTISWTANETEAEVYTSNELGQLQVTGLSFGTYYLQETKAPNGFQLLKDDQEFEIKEGSFDDGESLAIANVSKGGFLPSTGGKGIIAFLAIGLVMMLGAVIRYRRIQQAVN
ncbi:LPXTG-domain-containing protein cell wall anchor domain [Enterococcus hermanniensis]|uniref:LPXTG-domain-containing protein cell wall anchor domain n=1 Tax=Enterococcus hermanniensis TaxID=249189 RepID=A0A1L8TMD3_9ENTE|nr:LPXTG-domain-containing protein cell wall anchor domain [Enterococcus hermanniensis]